MGQWLLLTVTVNNREQRRCKALMETYSKLAARWWYHLCLNITHVVRDSYLWIAIHHHYISIDGTLHLSDFHMFCTTTDPLNVQEEMLLLNHRRDRIYQIVTKVRAWTGDYTPQKAADVTHYLHLSWNNLLIKVSSMWAFLFSNV